MLDRSALKSFYPLVATPCYGVVCSPQTSSASSNSLTPRKVPDMAVDFFFAPATIP